MVREVTTSRRERDRSQAGGCDSQCKSFRTVLVRPDDERKDKAKFTTDEKREGGPMFQ
jgi:hypothetical protein